MPLTPLHYNRGEADEVWYGNSFYITDCGRFEIWKPLREWGTKESSRVWKIDANELQDLPGYEAWSAWIEESGLSEATFSTRRTLLETLTDMLHAESIYDEALPKNIDR